MSGRRGRCPCTIHCLTDRVGSSALIIGDMLSGHLSMSKWGVGRGWLGMGRRSTIETFSLEMRV